MLPILHVSGRPSSYELYREERRTPRVVSVGIEGDDLIVETSDRGEIPRRLMGDVDYEFWTIVERAAWPDLAVALVREFLSGDPKATERLREICERHGVPHQRGSWT